VSVDSLGAEADGDSFEPSISADGRYVAFESLATNLVSADTNTKSDVFVHDRETGQTVRVSVSSAGAEAGDHSFLPAISGSGRFVAFQSDADDLVPGDLNTQIDIFVHDLFDGSTERVSVDSLGNEADGESFAPEISGDGDLLAFRSAATNLVAGDGNGKLDVFVHERSTGLTTRVSVSSLGAEGDDNCGSLALSADGQVVAFESKSTNLVAGDTNTKTDIFAHDRTSGATTRVSVATGGAQASDHSIACSISADGDRILFQSAADDLIAGDSNGKKDQFLHVRSTGVTSLVSRTVSGGLTNGDSLVGALSADGRQIGFESAATNVVPADSNGKRDIFCVSAP
jgi:Tol biopolymer transport system component